MKVVFDRDTCIGMYQCVEEWDRFERNVDAGKADLVGGDLVGETGGTDAEDRDGGEDGADGMNEADEENGADGDDREVYELTVPEGEEFEAEFAARVCPVDAIAVYDEDGEQIV